jgi:hypothetical protein
LKARKTSHYSGTHEEPISSEDRASERDRREEKHNKYQDSEKIWNEEEDAESMGQKLKAFLHARSDAQTESG